METAEQAQFLRQQGCHSLQGWLLLQQAHVTRRMAERCPLTHLELTPGANHADSSPGNASVTNTPAQAGFFEPRHGEMKWGLFDSIGERRWTGCDGCIAKIDRRRRWRWRSGCDGPGRYAAATGRRAVGRGGKFQQAGLGEVVQSWVGTSQPAREPSRSAQALGPTRCKTTGGTTRRQLTRSWRAGVAQFRP